MHAEDMRNHDMLAEKHEQENALEQLLDRIDRYGYENACEWDQYDYDKYQKSQEVADDDDCDDFSFDEFLNS